MSGLESTVKGFTGLKRSNSTLLSQRHVNHRSYRIASTSRALHCCWSAQKEQRKSDDAKCYWSQLNSRNIGCCRLFLLLEWSQSIILIMHTSELFAYLLSEASHYDWMFFQLSWSLCTSRRRHRAPSCRARCAGRIRNQKVVERDATPCCRVSSSSPARRL